MNHTVTIEKTRNGRFACIVGGFEFTDDDPVRLRKRALDLLRQTILDLENGLDSAGDVTAGVP